MHGHSIAFHPTPLSALHSTLSCILSLYPIRSCQYSPPLSPALTSPSPSPSPILSQTPTPPPPPPPRRPLPSPPFSSLTWQALGPLRYYHGLLGLHTSSTSVLVADSCLWRSPSPPRPVELSQASPYDARLVLVPAILLVLVLVLELVSRGDRSARRPIVASLPEASVRISRLRSRWPSHARAAQQLPLARRACDRTSSRSCIHPATSPSSPPTLPLHITGLAFSRTEVCARTFAACVGSTCGNVHRHRHRLCVCGSRRTRTSHLSTACPTICRAASRDCHRPSPALALQRHLATHWPHRDSVPNAPGTHSASSAARSLRTAGMYSMHPVQALSNGGIGNGIMDPSGTINPAALNSAGMTCPLPSNARARKVVRRCTTSATAVAETAH